MAIAQVEQRPRIAGIDLASIIPYEERLSVWKKSNIMFKLDVDSVLVFWRRFADPLRGTIIKAYNKYLLISYEDPRVIHVSDIVRMLIYGESNNVSVLDEHRVRILARGILYHYLFRKRFGDRVKAVFEFPIVCNVGSVIVVGTIDMLVTANDGYYIVELKSTNTETTINFGVIQVKAYWSILENFHNIKVTGAYVSTPRTDIFVDRPISKRELRRLVALYAKATNRASVIDQLPLHEVSLEESRLGFLHYFL